MCAIFGLDRLVCALTVLCVLEIGTGLLNALLLSLGPADSVAVVRPPPRTGCLTVFPLRSDAFDVVPSSLGRYKAFYLQAKARIWP